MRFPSQAEEIELHERLLAQDPVASVDLFQGYVEPLQSVVRYALGCSDDEAYDSVIDAFLA